jgi:hypothetical protein
MSGETATACDSLGAELHVELERAGVRLGQDEKVGLAVWTTTAWTGRRGTRVRLRRGPCETKASRASVDDARRSGLRKKDWSYEKRQLEVVRDMVKKGAERVARPCCCTRSGFSASLRAARRICCGDKDEAGLSSAASAFNSRGRPCPSEHCSSRRPQLILEIPTATHRGSTRMAFLSN